MRGAEPGSPRSVAECCSTPYSLVGLTFTVSYLALGVLNLCKFYLLGFGAFHNGNVMHRSAPGGLPGGLRRAGGVPCPSPAWDSGVRSDPGASKMG